LKGMKLTSGVKFLFAILNKGKATERAANMNRNFKFRSNTLVGNLNRIALILVLFMSASAFRCGLGGDGVEPPQVNIENARASRDPVTDLPVVTVDYTVKYPNDVYTQTMPAPPGLTCSMEQGQFTRTRTFNGNSVRVTGTTGKIQKGQATITVPESGRGIGGEFSITCTLTTIDNKTLNTSNTISVDVPQPTENSGNVLQLQGPPEVKENYTTNGNSGVCTFTHTATTIKVNCVSTENILDVSWTFKGVPQYIKQGEKVTIEITGEASKRDIATNFLRSSAEVATTAMHQISGDTVSIGDLETGWTPRATTTFVFEVDPNASEATISLSGYGHFAVYRYKKRE